MLRAAAASVLTALLMVIASPLVLAEPPPGNGVTCPDGGCGVGAVDPGSAGSPGAGPAIDRPRVVGAATHDPSSGSGSDGAPGAGGGAPVVAGPACSEVPMSPQPAAGSPWWDGHSAADGQVVKWLCTGGMTPDTCVTCIVLIPHFAASGAAPGAGPGGAPAPAAPPPPTPEQLAQQAYQKLPIPRPSMHFGPDDNKIAAKYWRYWWVDNPGAGTATAVAGAVSVTATARLTSVTWSMGEPAAADALSTHAAPVTCQGPGTNPGPAVDTTVDPAPGSCAYMYRLRSTPERTGGTGTWPVTATANWTITWAANTGEAGTLPAPPTVSTVPVRVGAWSTVLVADGVSVPGG